MKKLKKHLLTASLALMACLTGVGMSSCKDKDMIVYTLNTNGGATIEDVEIKQGEEFSLPTPTREGYVFEGWYTNADLKGTPVTKVTATENMTYYAKWSVLYTITLNLNGGSLSVQTLKLKEGANIAEFMSAYVPTKDGYVFGAWFVGNSSSALTANTKMTGDITLTAKYKVGYTVKMYKQKLDLSGYDEPEIVQAYDYPGLTVTSEDVPVGFKEVSHQNTVYEIELKDNAAENVMERYFDRETYTVTFNPNYPNGAQGTSQSQTVIYGQEVSIPKDFKALGYCLMGWSTSATGDVVFATNYIQDSLFNAEENAESQTGKYLPTRNTDFYAVWKKGYIDMFAGGDYLYRLDETSEDIYLSRGDVFFKGTYDAESNEFEFSGEDFYLIGRLNNDGTFFYEDLNRRDLSCMLLEVGVGIVDTTTIYFDEYNGIQYSVKGGDGKTDVSKGTYLISEDGYYTATFTEGPLSGKTLTLITGYVNLGDKTVAAFQLRNDEDYNMGALTSFVVVDGQLLYYQNEIYSIKLSGFGTAAYNTGSEVEGYYYTREGDTLTLMTDQGQTHGVYRLVENNNIKGYLPYNELLDNTFTAESGDTVTLDGTHNATYVKDGVTLTGLYSVKESLSGKALATMYVGSETYVFHLSVETNEVTVEGETSTVTDYVAEEKLSTYKEYYYQDAQGIYYAPMLALDDPATGGAILYGYTINRTHEEVSRGTYSYDETTGLYTYTADPASLTHSENVIDQPMVVTNIVEIVFAVIHQEPFYNISYWYSIKTEDGERKELQTVYTCEGESDLRLVGGIAYYDGNIGNYAPAGKNYPNLIAINVNNNVFYVEVDEENKTYVKLDHVPYTAKVWTKEKTEAFSLDGKGGATYIVATGETDKDGKAITVSYVGTYEKTDKTTPFGFYVFKFTGSDGETTKTFEFIQFSTSSSSYISIRDDVYTGEYRDVDGELILDGFRYMAKFTDAEGQVYEAVYAVESENVILLSTEDAYFYFDIKNNTEKTFTLRGLEAGTYILVNNQSLSEGYVVLDGYGKLQVFNSVKNSQTGEYERVDIDLNGSYVVNTDEIVLTYTQDGNQVVLRGALSYMEYGENWYNTFVVEYDTFATSFVNEKDWSVIMFNGYGDALKYGQKGGYEYGSYTIVTDELFYYVNEAGTDAALYKYDLEKGTATPLSLNPKGYYTEDLQSLRFTRYGFAIFNGTDRYYYNIENSKVYIYTQDISNPDANEYGFVKEEFGTFEKEIEYEGKTYYENDGFALSFYLDDASEKYPIQTGDFAGPGMPIKKLTFTPSGDTEFSVAGKMTFDDSGKTYDCVVTREYNADGELEMYVTYNYYRLDINVSYNGVDISGESNKFSMTRLRAVETYLSYMYMDLYYMIYSMLGSSMANSFPNQYGMIMVTTELNTLGLETSKKISGVFGTFSEMYDTNGELLFFEEVDFEYIAYDMTFKTSLYHITLTAEDNYVYHCYFTLARHEAFGLDGYRVIAVTREEVITTGTLNLTVQKIITTDLSNYQVGDPFKVVLKDGDTKLYEGQTEVLNGEHYCIVRERDENKRITKTTYYHLNLVNKVSAGMEESNVVDLYDLEKSSVTAKTVKTYYDATSTNTYFDVIDPEGENVPTMFVIGNTIVQYVAEYTYDAQTKTYTVLMTDGARYAITIGEDDVMTCTRLEETPSEQQ